MAETFLTPVIQSLIQLLSDELRSLQGIHKEVQSLKKELEIIQSLLKDADAVINKEGLISDAMKTWMKHLREVADHIDCVVDEYRWHVAQGTTDKRGFIGFFCKIGGRIKSLNSRCPISSQIQDINQSLQRIKESSQGFGLSESLQRVECSSSKTSCAEEQGTRLGSHFVEQDDEYLDVPLIQSQLKSSLVEGVSARTVISLVGQGGIGKTTLVKKVYDEVKHRFDCHAWITVSQSYDVKILLRNTIKQMGLTAECTTSHYDMMIQELITPLRQHLQKKRYVIIFDDVWDVTFWEVMKHALSSNNNGSRVIITTRNEVVVPCDFIHRLETWSFNMAYELFCKKTFRHEFEGRCPKSLEKLSHEIVQKCQGLPLAIGAIAGLLSRKRKVQFEWQKVLDDVNFELETNPQLARIFKILSLSYQDLPYHLKPCLLYFGIFPEDFLIWDFKLSQLWISEGFVQVREGKSLLEETKGYFNELVERSLVSFEADGLRKKFKVHDLMHEFITSKVNDLCFCQILSNKKSKFEENKHRRLSIHGKVQKSVVRVIQQYTTIRSILLVNFNDADYLIINRPFLMTLFKKLKLLKVLDFENAALDYLPKEVGNLFHLKYLNLKGTLIKVLPKSIGKLHNLQHLNLESTQVCRLPKSIGKLHNLYTLNLMYTFVRELPMKINKLHNLQHILAWTKDELGLNIQKGFGYLENLETLQRVEMHEDVAGFTKEIESLSNLKSLGICKLSEETSRVVCMTIMKLNHLRHLFLNTGDVDEILDLELISSPPSLLLSLFLYGQLKKFPHWISELTNLEALVLRFSKLSESPLKYLKDLPNLICLRLYDMSYEGEELHFEEGSFPKLNELYLSHLQELKLIKMDRGTLPLLKELMIQSCPQLVEVSSSIQYLTKLKRLCIWDMPREFVDGVKSNGGFDYSKIQHLPIMNITKFP